MYNTVLYTVLHSADPIQGTHAKIVLIYSEDLVIVPRVLDLTSCSLGVTDTGVARLASCLHLVHLKVSYLHQVSLLPWYSGGGGDCSLGVTDTGVARLASCLHLVHLKVSYLHQVSLPQWLSWGG